MKYKKLCVFFILLFSSMQAASNNKYAEINCSNEDSSKIHEIINTMARHSKISLLIKHKSRLEKLGDEVTHVHPFKFLGVIFSDNSLKKNMKTIYEDYFKKSSFVGALVDRLDFEASKNNIYKYLDGFANEVKKDKKRIKQFVDKKKWNELVEFLVYDEDT